MMRICLIFLIITCYLIFFVCNDYLSYIVTFEWSLSGKRVFKFHSLSTASAFSNYAIEYSFTRNEKPCKCTYDDASFVTLVSC